MDPPPPPYPIPHLYPPPMTAVSAAPTFTPATVEAQNNIITTTHVAANPTPAPNPAPNHPPYAEMIYGAITALREKDGSSKRAIEKYIERVYSGLPATHSSLLTHHLKRLKNSGHLVMVKKSYRLPGSEGSVPPPPPPPTSAVDAASTAAIPFPGPARGRGRPPKNNPISDHPISQQPISQQFIPFPQQPFPILQLPTLQQPIPILEQPNSHHQQPIPIPIPQQPNSQPVPDEPNSQPMLVALGLADEPGSEKRRPGRPRKVVAGAGVGQAVGSPVSGKRGRGRPLGTRLPKKKAGRPPKPKSVSAVGGPNGIVKRGRGRPSKAEPKSVFFPYATNVPIIGAFEQSNVPNVVAPQQPQPGVKRRGRPSKKKEEAASAATVRVGGMVPGKRGRPPGLPGIKRPSKKSGRPVGRPRKNASAETTEAPHPKSVANGQFKRKLEYFQFKVGQAVGALKPYLNPESADDAVAAIQELEGLATMDISAPLDIQAQQPPMLQS